MLETSKTDYHFKAEPYAQEHLDWLLRCLREDNAEKAKSYWRMQLALQAGYFGRYATMPSDADEILVCDVLAIQPSDLQDLMLEAEIATLHTLRLNYYRIPSDLISKYQLRNLTSIMSLPHVYEFGKGVVSTVNSVADSISNRLTLNSCQDSKS